MRSFGWMVALLMTVAVVAAARWCAPDRVVVGAITPAHGFDRNATPPAPDYSDDRAWLALPTTDDAADIALPELPSIAPGAAQVDVFYLHPTSSLAADWNTAHDDGKVRKASIRGGTLIQASVFNACCAVYAATYRQASGAGFLESTESGRRALDLAYSDVVAAFEEFERRAGGRRPFILAGHSQGSVLGARLLRERIVGGASRSRLVAAYLVGAPLTDADLGGLHACSRSEGVACVITFNARGPDYERNAFEFGTLVPEASRLCVNPTLGVATSELVPRSRHRGAVFFDAKRPALVPEFAATQCRNGRLAVLEPRPLPKRDLMSGILLWVMGGENYHPIEYQLFYADLREDAARRTSAFLGLR